MKVNEIVLRGRKLVDKNIFASTTISLFFLMFFLPLTLIDNFLALFLQLMLIVLFIYYFCLFFELQRESNIDKVKFYKPIKKINKNIFGFLLNSLFPFLFLILSLFIFLMIESYVLKDNIEVLMAINNAEEMVKNENMTGVIIGGFAFFAYFLLMIGVFVLMEVFLYNKKNKYFTKNIKEMSLFFYRNVTSILLMFLRMLPWLLISIFTFGIGELYLMPYYISVCNELVLEYLEAGNKINALKNNEDDFIRI